MVTKVTDGVVQFSRSKNNHNVLFYYYRYALLTFVGTMIMFISIALIDDGWEAFRRDSFDSFMWIGLFVSAIFTFFFSWLGKGSLVESIAIDYADKVITVTYYRLPSTLCERKLLFEGLRWDVLNGGKGWDRLRLKPKEGKKVVVCIDHLGWKFEDCLELKEALNKITPKDKKWYE